MNQENKNPGIRSKKIFGIFPLLSFSGLLLGFLGGYAYYYFIGCQSGSCAITSNPWLSVAWGGALGYLLLDMLYKRDTKKQSEKPDID